MTSATQPARYNLNLPSMDDEMEMATSPYRQVDDIDLDLDPMHDPVDENLLGGSDHLLNDELDLMQADTEVAYQDDDMVDDDLDDQPHELVDQDLHMEASQETNIGDQDEDIMFEDDDEEEAEVNAIRYESDGDVEPSDTVMPVDLEQERVQEQAHADPATTVQDAYTKKDQDRAQDQQQQDEETTDREDAQLSGDHNKSDQELNLETTDLSTVHTTDNEQAYLKHENIKETHAPDTIDNDTSDDVGGQKILKNWDQTSGHDDVEQLPDNDDEQEGNEFRLQLEAAPQDKRQTDDQNAPAAIEAEQLNPSAMGTSQTNDNDEAFTTESVHDLHSVVVIYLGQEMSLFPPSVGDSSATFFLADPTLAYDPFEKLLVACRGLLGESLEHDDELVLDIPTLGLHISEDSKYASEIGLAQVLEVYLALSRNEVASTPGPLYCHLSSRVCLSSQYAYLATSAQEGKCYTEIAADYADSAEGDVEAEADAGDYDEISEHQQNENDEQEDEMGQDHFEQENDPKPPSEEQEQQHEPFAIAQLVEFDESTIEQSSKTENAITVTSTTQTDHLQKPDTDIGSAEGKISHEYLSSASLNEHDLPTALDEEQELLLNKEPANHNIDEVHVPIPEQSNEVQTPSSHTIEAEHASSQQDLHEEQVSSSQTNGHEPAVTTAQVDVENVGGYGQDDIEYSDEELFNEDDEVEATQRPDQEKGDPDVEEDLFAEQPNGHVTLSSATAELDTVDQERANNQSNDQAEQPLIKPGVPSNASEQVDDENLPFEDEYVSDPATPLFVTPSKLNGNKRKVLDDQDELAFLDFDTPEPKRRRPS